MFGVKRKKTQEEHIMILDPGFPGNSYKGFRARGIIGLFNDVPGVKSFRYSKNYPPGRNILYGLFRWFKRTLIFLLGRNIKMCTNNVFDHYLGNTKKRFLKNKRNYSKLFPKHQDKICWLDYSKKYKAKLAYVIFLNIAFDLLPFFEKNKIPFVFVLYPGGGFGFNEARSDKKLKRVFKSPCFRKVFIRNKMTRQYLLKKKFCTEEQMHSFRYKKPMVPLDQIHPKVKYPGEKATFDIVFVAYKYSRRGVDKGYDLFIDAAKFFAMKYEDMRFHVVGNFSTKDIDVEDIKDKIIFYGVKDTDFLVRLYSRMDVFLSPNRPFVLGKGRFDGFPLGGHAQFCGVALFVTDELKLNTKYKKDEIVIIKPTLEDVVSKVEMYYKNPDALYSLSLKGQKKHHQTIDKNKSRQEKIDFFDALIKEG